MRKLTESIVMLLALAACGSDAGTEVADSPTKELPEARTSAPAMSTGTAGKPATATTSTSPNRAGAGAAPSSTPTADAGSKSVAPSSGAAGSTAASSGGAGGANDMAGAAAAAADGGSNASGAAGAAGGGQGVPCEVSKALAASCQRCHGSVPANGAPMSLVTLADFEALTVGGKPRVPKWQAALNRMNGTRSPPMPPATSPITDEDRQTLIDWLGEEAPAGDACP